LGRAFNPRVKVSPSVRISVLLMGGVCPHLHNGQSSKHNFRICKPIVELGT
jgi:hypothetical protein